MEDNRCGCQPFAPTPLSCWECGLERQQPSCYYEGAHKRGRNREIGGAGVLDDTTKSPHLLWICHLHSLYASQMCLSQRYSAILAVVKHISNRYVFYFLNLFLFYHHLRTFFTLLLKREEGRDIDVTLIGCLLHAPWPGTEPTTWECALTGIRTHYLSIYGMTLQ